MAYQTKGPFSEERTFTTKSALKATITSPADDAENLPVSTDLVWEGGEAALEIATDPRFGNITHSKAKATSPYRYSFPEQLTTYYWRVKIKVGGCEGNWASASLRTGSCLIQGEAAHLDVVVLANRRDTFPRADAGFERLLEYADAYPTSQSYWVYDHNPLTNHAANVDSAAAQSSYDAMFVGAGGIGAEGHFDALKELLQSITWNAPGTTHGRVVVLFIEGADDSINRPEHLEELVRDHFIYIVAANAGASLTEMQKLAGYAKKGKVYDATNKSGDALREIVTQIGDDIIGHLCAEIAEPTPGKITLQSPTDGAGCVQNPITFTWDADANAASYEIQVARDSNYIDLVTNKTTTQTSYSDSYGGGEVLYWRVRAKSPSGKAGLWSVGRQLRTYSEATCDLPGEPVLHLKASDPCMEYVNRDNVELSWDAGLYADSYEVQVATDQAFSNVVVSRSTASLSVTIAVPQDGTYYWRVRSVNGNGESAWTDADSFCICPDLSAVTITSPTDGATCLDENSVPVEWSADSQAASYELQVDTDSAFSSPTTHPTTGTTHTLSGLNQSTTYYLRVRSISAGGADGPWSNPVSFSTFNACQCSAPAVPEPFPTSDEACNTAGSRTFTVGWDAVPCADTYSFEVSRYADFSDTVAANTVSDTQATFTVPEDDREYYWRVRANNVSASPFFGPVKTRGFG